MDEKEIVRVLLVDDDEDDYVLTRDLFAEIEGGRYKLDWVDSYEEGYATICRGEHDVYLVDYRLGAHTGLELLREVLAIGCRSPIILLTGQGDREVDIEAMRCGAADYLIKMQTGAPLLERSIRYAIERKKTEGGIIAAEQRFRAVFEQSADAVLLVELETRRIIDTNVAFRQLLGFTQEELLQMTVYDFISGSREQIDEYIREVTQKHYFFIDECGFVTNTGGIRQVEASLNFISYGTSRAISIMARDLSQRKERNTTGEAAGEKLVSDLLNGITSEFRTPLTSIMGMTSLLERELASSEKQAYTRMLSNSVSGLISILGHVSTIMRCRNLPQETFEQFPIVRVLREIAVGFEKTARAKNIGMQINIRSDALIRADLTLFSRAVGALLDNAVHFTNRGVIFITVDAQTTENGYQAFLQISDTGSGIANDLLPRVFEPFVRQFHEKGAQQEGRGLGLTIAKNAFEALGGTIRLISVEGEGTTALCTLPAEPVVQTHGGIKQEQEMPERYTGLPQMLVIEDDKGYQKLITRHFDGIYRIDCADTAEQAISLCENDTYSLILVDINLGYGRSGIDALTAIRRLPGYQDIPAIAVTAYSFELKRKELFEAGFTDYIQKPFTQSQILGVVSRHIAASRRIAPLPLS